MERLVSLVGLIAFIGIAYLLSTNRKAVNWRLVAWGVGLQLFFAILVLPDSFFNNWIKSLLGIDEAPGAMIFRVANDAIVKILDFTKEGMKFLASSFSMGRVDPSFENFIFDVLPTILFFSGLMSVLYHLGAIQILVRGIARLMRKTMGTSGSESLSAAANIFVGQTEAPLVIKPYVETMTRSELLAIMTGGMATVSGGVMAAYVAFLGNYFPNIAGHLMAASVMSAPAALVIAKILIPETEESVTAGDIKIDIPRTSANVIDAAATGATEGLKLAMNVAAMLMVFIALIALFDYLLGGLGKIIGLPGLSFSVITGYLFSPLAFLMGVPLQDVLDVASLLGIKTIVNEFVAFKVLSDMLSQPITPENPGLSQKSIVLATYALCGFSNFSSIAIQIGGIGTIAPSRRKDLAELGIRALIAGTFACLMTATIAGLITTAEGRSTLRVQRPKAIRLGETHRFIEDTFLTLKNKLKGKETIGIRRNYWKTKAKGRWVNWSGRFYKVHPQGILIYYGIKDMEEVNGQEPDCFLLYKIDPEKLETMRFTIWRKQKDKKGILRTIEYHLPLSDIRRGDEVRNIVGILDGYQLTPQILFTVEQKKPPWLP